MRKVFPVTAVLGGVLFCFGIFWLTAIWKRCEVISPAPSAKSSSLVEKGNDVPVQEDLKKYRLSPHLKPYHVILLWVLVSLEVAVAFGYAVAGFALLRQFFFGVPFALVVLAGDALFKLSVAGYMQFCAVPLAKFTENPNILFLYFLADSGFFKYFSAFTSGLILYLPQAIMGLMYLVFIGVCGFCLWQTAGQHAGGKE